MRKIKVVVADDSSYMRQVITKTLASDEMIEIIAAVSNGKEAVSVTAEKKPDVLVLDIEMPEMDGIQVLKSVLRDFPLPVIMLSSFSRDSAKVMLSLEIGAVDFVRKPGHSISLADIKDELIQKVKAAASASIGMGLADIKSVQHGSAVSTRKIVAIAASTGGPSALCQVIPVFPAKLSVPVIVIQHMPENFTRSLADRLQQMSRLSVKESEDGEEILSGVVYVAKGGHHTRIEAKNGSKYVRLTKEPAVNGVRPAADVTFRDIADVYGKGVIAAVLTGMGEDGALGAVNIRTAGGTVIAQDQETSTIYGMPKAVAARNAADFVLPLACIPAKIVELVDSVKNCTA
ncbi:MAG: chemotaxis response regulator protein-glutamate methylesterase [Planctomycetes bacterium]|nr:chemotaxis response regulator protein-glutamate methylesterase [Planctomycetota bacterium]